jgi:hypothetical protein
LDWQALLEALAASGMLDGDPDDQDAVLAEECDAWASGRMGPPLSPSELAALAVEHMEPGPALAGWLNVATSVVDTLDETAAAGVAIAARRQTAHAQAAELAAVARITALAAAADPKIGVSEDGRPARLCRDALGQISLALTMSPYRTGSWADLAVTLTWRLPGTSAALAAGRIDLDRARKIAEATAVLSDEAARSVEEMVLPRAATETTALLKRRLRHAVIKADPQGTEDRRKKAQRQADVRLYADPDQTASLTADKLPQIETAAGYARLTAMARARKAAGMPGTLGYHRAQVLVGMLQGTLPPTPPPDGAPPDGAPPDGAPPDEGLPDAGPADPDTSANPGPANPGGSGGAGRVRSGGDLDSVPMPGDEDAPDDDGLDGYEPDDDGLDPDDDLDDLDDLTGTGPLPDWPALGTIPPGLARPGHNSHRPGDDRHGHARNSGRSGRPPPGPLEITLPWTVLAGLSDDPGALGRIGPVTATQARQLTRAAEHDPASQWRIVVTDITGQAVAVSRVRRRTRRTRRTRDGPGNTDGPACQRPSPSPSPGTGLVGQVMLTITVDALARLTASGSPCAAGSIATAALRAAGQTRSQTRAQGGEDSAAEGGDSAAEGCAHSMRSAAYRPPPRVRDIVIARDQTCRFPTCGMPAGRGDLDHTIPYDHGGPTCPCNLGAGCRGHHQLKQHPRWRLEQRTPGVFTWTTPAGRSYTARPDPYPT